MNLAPALQTATQRGKVGARRDGEAIDLATVLKHNGRSLPNGQRDNELVHMRQDELASLDRMWGKHTANPSDGLPEFIFGNGTSSANYGGGMSTGGKGYGGKTSGSGSLAASSHIVSPQAPGASVAAAAANGDPSAGTMQATESNAGRTFASNDPNRLSANPNNAETQNRMRAGANYTGPGATPYISDPSWGQILGAIFSTAPIAGTLNNLSGVASDIYTGDNPSGVYTGGALGQVIDGARGVEPGQVTGSSNPDANSGFRATKGEFSSNHPYSPAAWLTNSPLMQALVNPKIYSSNDASIVR